MSFFKDFIDNLFGIKNNNRDNSNQGNDHEHFRNPIWQNDQGDDDDDNTDDYRSNHFVHSGPGIHFEVFTDPIEITRFFESEMENLMKSFFSFGLDIPAIENIPSAYENTQSSGIGKKNLRDEVLKPEFSRNYDFNRPKIDEDLDGKIKAGELSTAWNNSKDPESQEVLPHIFLSTSQSTVYKFTKHLDGTVEETKITTDSSGNTEQIIKRKTGDNKIHTVIMKKDNKGIETETATFENMVESKNEAIERAESSSSSFPWHKFFGDIPKI
ncbi:hypothetical protein HCN44_005216 [Aphidius gifuensis]|uniref:Uncharacterized protein n=1 Tax=Aphidius gifuensis TaxID=684658 RepID=A0A834XWJ8_APHGI|nr:uncharacterized protein LOC122852350 [Aphidius gifuensis]KAF7992872.1 hypothetical protein HCN44_005216 [Aphidius gifuensis]